MDDLTDQEVLASVEAELRPGGRPYARYQQLGVVHRGELLGAALTSRLIGNLEERICELERRAGLTP